MSEQAVSAIPEVAGYPLRQQATPVGVTPAGLLQIAVQNGASMEMLERLIALQERVEANEARKAYVSAVASFKANPPEILKDKDNVQYGSKYTSLANIVRSINSALSMHGLNARWDLSQNTTITVACVLSHVMGHSERVQLSGPPDDSGKKNALQQIKSTVTYLEAATLLAITGLAAVDETDDDGNGGERPDRISDEQVATLRAMIAEVTSNVNTAKLYEEKLCAFLKAETLEVVLEKNYANAIAQIDARKKKIAAEKEKGESK